MDLKIVLLGIMVFAAIITSSTAGKHKKVVIHVPYKVKKIKHTHTIYKTIHHHHGGHGGHGGHGHGHGHEEAEEHEHFHHHGDSKGHHTIISPHVVLPDVPHHQLGGDLAYHR